MFFTFSDGAPVCALVWALIEASQQAKVYPGINLPPKWRTLGLKIAVSSRDQFSSELASPVVVDSLGSCTKRVPRQNSEVCVQL